MTCIESLAQVKTVALSFVYGSGASRSARVLMASEEMVEELEKALGDLQLKVSDMQTTYSSMERNLRLEIETLKAEKLEQDIQMERMRQDYIKNTKPDERGTISGIKGYDFKHAPKPEQYDFGEEKEFYAWRDLFLALLSAHDEQWDVILGEVEKMGKRVINEAELKEIQSKLAMESDVMNKCTKILYTTLLQYTKGDARVKVTSGGMKGAMESFRYIVHKGRNTTMTSIMHRRMKVMNPEVAKNAEDVEKKIQMWKNDIRLLLESRQEQDIKMMENNDQMITILISMLPDRVAEYLMTKYEVGVTALDEMEVALQEHMMKIVENSLRSKSGRKIGQVANQLGEGGDEEEDWQQHWDAQGGEYWIRTAMKRPRTEEHEFERNRMQRRRRKRGQKRQC